MLEGPTPKVWDTKQIRVVIPEEAKEVRTTSAPAYSLEKDSRPWCREGNPVWAGQRKWSGESRETGASIAHRVEYWEERELHWEENSKICRRPPSNSPLSWWANESEEITQKDSREQCPEWCLFPTARRENFINHGWWTTAGVGNPRCQAKSSPTLTFVNTIFLKYRHTHFFMYLLWLLSRCNDKVE